MHAEPRTPTILIVEDSAELIALLERTLGEHGYLARSARDGETGLASALENVPDLLILDVGLPRRNGFEVVQELRRRGVIAPTLMLTGRADVADRVTGLEAGADDYLVKPFEPDELVARVRALLRRAADYARVPPLRVGDLVLDPVARRVSRGARRLALTERELSLLECFMRNAGKPLSRAAITAQVWRQSADDTEDTNIVDVYVAYLRRKLDTNVDEPMLHTVRGVGYVLRASASGKRE
jgi:DNA-binding response OmpR family regulator